MYQVQITAAVVEEIKKIIKFMFSSGASGQWFSDYYKPDKWDEIINI